MICDVIHTHHIMRTAKTQVDALGDFIAAASSVRRSATFKRLPMIMSRRSVALHDVSTQQIKHVRSIYILNVNHAHGADV